MSELLLKAERIAREAHAGQMYGDRDYMEAHITPVVGIIARMGYGEVYQAAGFLHDSIEDNQAVTPQTLRDEKMPLEVVRAVDLLTKRPGQSQISYLGGLITSNIAVVVKFADSSANYANTILMTPEADGELFGDRVNEYVFNLAFLRPLLPKP